MESKMKVAAIVAVLVIVVAVAGAVVLTGNGSSDDNVEKKGFYRWDPTVVEVNGDYSNCTISFMTNVETVYKAVYGNIPSYENIERSAIPSNYFYGYTDYVTENADGTLAVKTFDNNSKGTSEAYADKVISFVPTNVIAYSEHYIDTIYVMLCQKNGEKAHTDNTPKALAELWGLVKVMPQSVAKNLESKYGISVPSSVKIIGGTQEDLIDYCSKLSSDEKTVVFMSEYNIRSTNKSSWWDNNQRIESGTNGNVQFVYILSNSTGMVLSSIEMIGEVTGIGNTEEMMTDLLAEIYVMQKSIDDKYASGEYPTFYAETASVKSVGSNTLMGSVFADILKMKNIFEGSLMGDKISDEDIVLSEPQVIGFYTSDTRSMDERMRATE